jgi:hypothetical protein
MLAIEQEKSWEITRRYWRWSCLREEESESSGGQTRSSPRRELFFAAEKLTNLNPSTPQQQDP